jgi:hypothetical protein
MSAADLARHFDRADDLERLAIDDLDVVAVPDVEKRLIGPGRQRQVAREGVSAFTSCFRNLPSLENICTRRCSRSAT